LGQVRVARTFFAEKDNRAHFRFMEQSLSESGSLRAREAGLPESCRVCPIFGLGSRVPIRRIGRNVGVDEAA
jgi:hypothetical protein